MEDQLKKDNKRVPGSNTLGQAGTFAGLTLIGVPIFLTVLLPSAIISVTAKTLMNLVAPPKMEDRAMTSEVTSTDAKLTSASPREFDIVIYGATGFTGKLCAMHIAKTYGTSIRWAIAGRNRVKLEEIRTSLGPQMKDLPLVIADSGNAESLFQLVRRTKVVVTTAGPFQIYGSELVKQCAENGTHYCDITGEIDWVRIMIDKFDDVARRSGAKIVSMCGHDCIPWDLSVQSLANEFKKRGDSLRTVDCYDEIRASASGGTMATVFVSLENRIKYTAALGFDPLLKTAQGSKAGGKFTVDFPVGVHYSAAFKQWTGYFVMCSVMGNCVRRSNALLGYSDNLKYTEVQAYPNFFSAANSAISLMFLGTIIVTPPLKWLCLKLGVIPSPGEGPSAKFMDTGYLRITALGKGQKADSKTLKSTFYFPTDPGYRDTARMLAESGLLLALENEKTSKEGGVMTPAAALGEGLRDRLVATGSQFSVEEV